MSETTLTEEQQATLAAAPIFALWFSRDEETHQYPLGLVPFISKRGNLAWQAQGSKAVYGVHISPLLGRLPEKATVSQVAKNDQGAWAKVEGSKDLTLTLKKAVTKGTPALPCATFQGKSVLPNGEDRMVHITVTLRQDGQWNIKASATGIGGGSSDPMDDVVFLFAE
jgi:hypothetical protein